MYTDILKDEISGETIILRRFTMNDVNAVFEYGSDEETMRYLVWDGTKTMDEAKASVENFYMPNKGVYAIALKESNICIGTIDIRIHEEHDKASFGYVLNRNYWGKGYMSEALYLVLKQCFHDLGLQRVESTHYKENIASGRVMQKCGMTYEGIARREVKVKGKYQDVVHYGILKEEFLVKERILFPKDNK